MGTGYYSRNKLFIAMRKQQIIKRLEKVDRLIMIALKDKNLMKVRQGYHITHLLKQELASISQPKLMHV